MRRITLLLISLLGLAVLAGCNGSSLTGTTDPGGTITGTVGDASLNALLPNDVTADPVAAGMVGGTDSPDEVVDGASELLGALAPSVVLPDSSHLLWWRKVVNSTANFNKSGTSDSVYVTTQRTNTGDLMGRLVHRGKGLKDTLLYQKPYTVQWTRTAIYKKIAVNTGEDNTHWALTAVSLANGVQQSPQTTVPVISSVVLSGTGQAGPVSVTFTDPTAMYDPSALPLLAAGDSIKVQAFTDGSDATRRVFIHFDWPCATKGQTFRRPLQYNSGTGAFEGSFVVREGYGKGHPGNLRARSAVWVDVIDKATLFDTEAPYAATCWGVPYRMFRHAAGSLALR